MPSLWNVRWCAGLAEREERVVSVSVAPTSVARLGRAAAMTQ